MALVNAPYLRDNLKALVRSPVESITAAARDARGKRPVAAITKVVDEFKDDHVEDLVEEVKEEAAHFETDVWVGEINYRKVAGRVLVLVIIFE